MTSQSIGEHFPYQTFVPLECALTFLCFGLPMDVHTLVAWASAARSDEERLWEQLTEEWRRLSDYACRGALIVRGRRGSQAGMEDVRLSEDDLRNCRHVGWRALEDGLQVHPFAFTFRESFQSRLQPGCLGFYGLDVDKKGLLEFCKLRLRFSLQSPHQARYDARRWLTSELNAITPMTGLRDAAINTMSRVFGMSTASSERMWKDVRADLGWPTQGRPNGMNNENATKIKNRWDLLPAYELAPSFRQPQLGAAHGGEMDHGS